MNYVTSFVSKSREALSTFYNAEDSNVSTIRSTVGCAAAGIGAFAVVYRAFENSPTIRKFTLLSTLTGIGFAGYNALISSPENKSLSAETPNASSADRSLNPSPVAQEENQSLFTTFGRDIRGAVGEVKRKVSSAIEDFRQNPQKDLGKLAFKTVAALATCYFASYSIRSYPVASSSVLSFGAGWLVSENNKRRTTDTVGQNAPVPETVVSTQQTASVQLLRNEIQSDFSILIPIPLNENPLSSDSLSRTPGINNNESLL